MPSDGGDSPDTFRDRSDAGRALAAALGQYSGDPEAIALGLPRGGIPVAYEVAVELGIELDAFTVRKLGVPGHEELAMGALATGGVRLLNLDLIGELGIGAAQVEAAVARQAAELERRDRAYRGDRGPLGLDGRTALLIDDGLATGASMLAAVEAARQKRCRKVVVAVPVAPPETISEVESVADEVHCLIAPSPLMAVGAWYDRFDQTGDEQVVELLRSARGRSRRPGGELGGTDSNRQPPT